MEDRWTHPTRCCDIKHLCRCFGQTFFISFCCSISPSGLFNECIYKYIYNFFFLFLVSLSLICSTVFLVSKFMGLFVSHLIAFNIKAHRGRYYTEWGVFKASNGTLRHVATSSVFCEVVGCNALLFLTGPHRNQSTRPFIFLYTTTPSVSTLEPALDSRLPLTHRERQKEREG